MEYKQEIAMILEALKVIMLEIREMKKQIAALQVYLTKQSDSNLSALKLYTYSTDTDDGTVKVNMQSSDTDDRIRRWVFTMDKIIDALTSKRTDEGDEDEQ